MGECYDARRELGGWSKPGFNDDGWDPVQVAPAPEIALEVSQGPPVRRIEELEPVSVRTLFTWPSEKRLFDFGQNFSGRVRVKVKAKRGTTLTIRHAEMTGPEADTAYTQTTLYTANLRKALAKDFYTCKGEGATETWEPRFTFHGFRHCEVTGLQKGDLLEVVGIVLHSDTPRTGSFACSHDLLNQLQSNILWGQKSNFLEVPTDCPQRDERLGWTGDAQVFIRTACFNMDVQGFFHKWMQDVRDAQGADGSVPGVCPNFDIADWGGPAWSDAVIICPWTIYLCYGDREILAENYESMRRYLDSVATKNCKGLIQCHPEVGAHCYGDWLALDGSGRAEGATPKDLIGTAFYAYVTDLMARIASLLGRKEDAAKYRALNSRIVSAFRKRFVTPEGLLVSGTQTSYILALKFNLLPEDVRPTAARELVREIERRGNHIGTGFVGTPYILEVLEENGYLDVAYKLLEQETFPSWIFPIKNGATTIWERWDGWTPDKGFQDAGMNSFNHYAYGAVGAWMYRSVAGIELDPLNPGYRHIIFRPRPGGSITWAKASLETPQGEVAIHWKKNGESLEVNLTIPKGAKATFAPPPGFSGGKKKFSQGTHRVSLRAKS
jgi:alpha-L-rhamnosidase